MHWPNNSSSQIIVRKAGEEWDTRFYGIDPERIDYYEVDNIDGIFGYDNGNAVVRKRVPRKNKSKNGL